MNNKIRALFGSVFFLWHTLSCSQNVIITISEEDSAKNDSTQTIGDSILIKLKIIYENRTNRAIYFAKVANECLIDDTTGMPVFAPIGLTNPPIKNMSGIDYSNDTLKVVVFRGSSSWEIVDNVDEPHLFLNDDLYLYYNNKNNYTHDKWYNRYQELVNDMVANKNELLTKYRDLFVFLKPGETYCDYFDISGLAYFKGHYSFRIKDSSLMDGIVVDNIFDTKSQKWNQIIQPYPERVGTYMLYTGPVVSNTLTIDF